MQLALTTDWPTLVGLLLLTLGVALLVWIASLLLRLLTDGAGRGPREADHDRWQAIEAQLAELKESQDSGTDLRRVEHLLVDLRDSMQRIQNALLEYSEQAAGGGGRREDGVWPLPDRLRARLLAMGFQRIELLPPDQGWEALESSDGEVRVEARRAGSLYKGRVEIEGGRLGEVHLRPSHSLFP